METMGAIRLDQMTAEELVAARDACHPAMNATWEDAPGEFAQHRAHYHAIKAEIQRRIVT